MNLRRESSLIIQVILEREGKKGYTRCVLIRERMQE